MKLYLYNVFILLLISNFCLCHLSEEEITKTVDEKIITCGSVLRIQNIMTKFQ
jgi:hypothetical protein